jgi:hypothetical protein
VGKPSRRFVAQAAADAGWRIWDKKARKWWGPVFAAHPAAVIDELNGHKRPERLTELMRASETRPAAGEHTAPRPHPRTSFTRRKWPTSRAALTEGDIEA